MSGPLLFAALHLPDLPVVAALRHRPELGARPCGVLLRSAEVLLEKTKLPLRAVNEAARRTGIEAGWPLNQALVRCPGLEVLPSELETEARLLQEIAAVAESLTPDLELTAPDTVVLDLSRAPRRLLQRLEFLELDDAALCHATAPTPDLAHLGVRVAEGRSRFVSPDFVHDLPLDLLACLPDGEELLPVLRDWGLARLGDLMKLPRQALIERLGPSAGRCHDLLHGRIRRLLRLHRTPESFLQQLDFEAPIASTEPLGFAFNRLLSSLSARLAARHLAVGALLAGLVLENGPPLERRLRLPEPQLTESELLRPLQTWLESLRLPAPVVGLTLDVEPVAPTAAQHDWLRRQLAQPARWHDTLARLEALLGPGRLGIPVPPASHLDDSFQLRLPGAACGENPAPAWLPACPVPLRRFRPPRPVAVAFDPPADRPSSETRPLALLNGPFPGPVLETRGPFRTSGSWWDPEKTWQRLEWDIRVGPHLLRLTLHPPHHWQLEGSY